MIDLNVLPLKGLGNITFGMTMESMTGILGKPAQVEPLVDDDDFNTTVLNYNDQGLSIFFEGAEAPMLSCIESDNKNCMLFGERAFDLSKQDLVALMKKNGFEDLDTSDEEWGEQRISFEDGLIDFYYANDKLTTINWGVLVTEEGKIESI